METIRDYRLAFEEIKNNKDMSDIEKFDNIVDLRASLESRFNIILSYDLVSLMNRDKIKEPDILLWFDLTVFILCTNLF